MRSQLHALAALLPTKECPVLIECEVRSRASQDVGEGEYIVAVENRTKISRSLSQ